MHNEDVSLATPAFWATMRQILDERAFRLATARAAVLFGRGGIRRMARLGGLSELTVSKGVKELDGLPAKPAGRPSGVGVRRKGSGPKIDPELRAGQKEALDALMEPHGRGGPPPLLRWTTKSLRTLAEGMKAKGFAVSHETLRTLLKEEGYSLQAGKRPGGEGGSPGRDLRFERIAETARKSREAGCPVLSVSAHAVKPEPPGNPEAGETGGLPEAATRGASDGKAARDTARFAADAIRQWWECMGRERHAAAGALFVAADGETGTADRSWEAALQEVADATGLDVFACRLPPGTAKWTSIGPRLVSRVCLDSGNRPPEILETAVALVGAPGGAPGTTSGKPDFPRPSSLPEGCRFVRPRTPLRRPPPRPK